MSEEFKTFLFDLAFVLLASLFFSIPGSLLLYFYINDFSIISSIVISFFIVLIALLCILFSISLIDSGGIKGLYNRLLLVFKRIFWVKIYIGSYSYSKNIDLIKWCETNIKKGFAHDRKNYSILFRHKKDAVSFKMVKL